MKIPTLNVELLRRIQVHITEEPRRFFMAWFTARGEPGGGWTRSSVTLSDLAATVPPCGTAHCIAGWTNVLSGNDKAENYKAACDFLGLPFLNGDTFGYDALFCDFDWPEPFQSRYGRAKTPQDRARIACERIDHLIATGE